MCQVGVSSGYILGGEDGFNLQITTSEKRLSISSLAIEHMLFNKPY